MNAFKGSFSSQILFSESHLMSLPLGTVPFTMFSNVSGFSHLSPQKEIGSLHFLPIVLVTIFRLEPAA